MDRPDWDSYFMEIAEVVSKRSTCLRRKVGQNHELCRGIHAEQNAVIQAAVNGVSTLGATLYCTHQPCVVCSKILINAGIVRIVYAHPYPDELAREMLASDKQLQLEVFEPGKKKADD